MLRSVPSLVDVPKDTLRDVKVAQPPLRFPARGGDGHPPPPETRKVDISVVETWVHEGDEEGEPHIALSAPVRNVGAGVAMIHDARLLVPRADKGPHIVVGTTRQATVPVGEEARVLFEIPHGTADFAPIYEAIDREEDLLAEVLYADLSGQQRSRTRLTLRHDGSGHQDMYRVFHARVLLVDEPSAATPWG